MAVSTGNDLETAFGSLVIVSQDALDSSRSFSQASQLGEGAQTFGADLTLAKSNIGNLEIAGDPAFLATAERLAGSSLSDAFAGLTKQSETSNLAVTKALELAKAAGEKENTGAGVSKISSAFSWALAAVAAAGFYYVAKKKGA